VDLACDHEPVLASVPIQLAPSQYRIRARTRLLESLDVEHRMLPSLELPHVRTVVVVPHPDDEALSTGGLIARQRRLGLDVVVVAVTDGEHAYSQWPGDDLAKQRRIEQTAALDELAQGVEVVRAHLPDGGVTARKRDLEALLSEIVRTGDLLVAPHLADWHPDHVAAGRAATAVAAACDATLLGSLFWAHHHPPSHLSGQVVVLNLTNDETTRRCRAVECHHSQLFPPGESPIVESEHWMHLYDPAEYYVVAP
jgi:LmbE family N-acetylglucosaminyl deacetylase